MEVNREGKVSLVNFAAGAAVERFDDELQRVLNNIVDPNMADGPREIVLTVKFTPDKQRQTAAIGIKCVPKLQPARSTETVVFVGKDRGVGIAFEHNPNQMKMSLEESKPAPTVLEGGKGKEAVNA